MLPKSQLIFEEPRFKLFLQGQIIVKVMNFKAPEDLDLKNIKLIQFLKVQSFPKPNEWLSLSRKS